MHFGIPDRASSLIRENLFCEWLASIENDASDVFILGDMFDFWFEWKHVVPKGYIRIFGKILEMSNKGVQFHFFLGNHDMWMIDYFSEEFKAKIYRKDLIIELQNKKFYLSHGDGLGPGDNGYKLLKFVFRGRFSKWLYSKLHPNFAIKLALMFSKRSRYTNIRKNNINNLRTRQLTISQIKFAEKFLLSKHIDYFIFGHQHNSEIETLSNNSILFNIGNWLDDYDYLVLENGFIKSKKFQH